jgi:hypothetical protein
LGDETDEAQIPALSTEQIETRRYGDGRQGKEQEQAHQGQGLP